MNTRQVRVDLTENRESYSDLIKITFISGLRALTLAPIVRHSKSLEKITNFNYVHKGILQVITLTQKPLMIRTMRMSEVSLLIQPNVV